MIAMDSFDTRPTSFGTKDGREAGSPVSRPVSDEEDAVLLVFAATLAMTRSPLSEGLSVCSFDTWPTSFRIQDGGEAGFLISRPD